MSEQKLNLEHTVRRYAHVIQIAMMNDIEHRQAQIAESKKTLASEHNDGSGPYKDLEKLVAYAEQYLKDQIKAHNALANAGLYKETGI